MKVLIVMLSMFTVFSCSNVKPISKFKVKKIGEMYYAGFSQVESRERVVVFDTGIIPSLLQQPAFCKDWASASIYSSLNIQHDHGTKMATIIVKGMDISKYCLSMIKLGANKSGRLFGMEKSLINLSKMPKINIVNMSLQGFKYKHTEYLSILRLLEKGVKINVAAGNSSADLNLICDTYPACFAKLIEREPPNINRFRSNFKVIGALGDYSNYGSDIVDIYLFGGPWRYAPTVGTPAATALYTNILVRKK